jgi:hypothetical protein
VGSGGRDVHPDQLCSAEVSSRPSSGFPPSRLTSRACTRLRNPSTLSCSSSFFLRKLGPDRRLSSLAPSKVQERVTVAEFARRRKMRLKPPEPPNSYLLHPNFASLPSSTSGPRDGGSSAFDEYFRGALTTVAPRSILGHRQAIEHWLGD